MGILKIVDDINNVNINYIKKEVNRLWWQRLLWRLSKRICCIILTYKGSDSGEQKRIL